MNDSCGNCRFWWKQDGQVDGACRFDPPQVVLVPVLVSQITGETGAQLVGQFPMTREDIWCGRHQAKANDFAELG